MRPPSETRFILAFRFRFTARTLCATVSAAVVGALCVPAASAAPGIKLGIFDDAQTLNSPGTAFLDYANLGVQVLRINLRWDQVAPTAPAGDPSNPGSGSYDQSKWLPYDNAVKAAAAATPRIQVMLDILGSPSWANGGKPSFRYAPTGTQLQAFAKAAATRYSGTYPDPTNPGTSLPRVLYWGAWNEPNLSTFLRPQWKRIGRRWVSVAPIQYSRICNQVFNGVHAAQTADSLEKVACGLTSPRGNNIPGSANPSHTPLLFLRGMKRGGARFDTYGHHPYSPKKSPTWKPSTNHMISLGNISVLVKELTRLYGKKRIWITEYGYETNPPDPHLGVSPSTQAAWLKQAFGIAKAHTRIDMFIWFLLEDEPDRNGGSFGVPGWQSGLHPFGGISGGIAKPAFTTFQNLTP
jgi:hypothetical protein